MMHVFCNQFSISIIIIIIWSGLIRAFANEYHINYMRVKEKDRWPSVSLTLTRLIWLPYSTALNLMNHTNSIKRDYFIIQYGYEWRYISFSKFNTPRAGAFVGTPLLWPLTIYNIHSCMYSINLYSVCFFCCQWTWKIERFDSRNGKFTADQLFVDDFKHFKYWKLIKNSVYTINHISHRDRCIIIMHTI